jgi:hypothetical protein
MATRMVITTSLGKVIPHFSDIEYEYEEIGN